MTEEDTFNRLKKVPISQLDIIVGGISDDEWNEKSRQEHEKFFAAHGWTYQEWLYYLDD